MELVAELNEHSERLTAGMLPAKWHMPSRISPSCPVVMSLRLEKKLVAGQRQDARGVLALD